MRGSPKRSFSGRRRHQGRDIGEQVGHPGSGWNPSQPFPGDSPVVDRSPSYKVRGSPKQSLPVRRQLQGHNDDDERASDSSSDWFNDPPSPLSLTSSLLALSPLSSFSTSISSDLDPVSDDNDEQTPHQPEEIGQPENNVAKCIEAQQPWVCIQCGSSLVPLSSPTTNYYLLSIPLRPSTHSQNPPRQTFEPTSRLASTRKRRTSDPPVEEFSPTSAANAGPSPIIPSTSVLSSTPTPARKTKKMRTTGPSASTVPSHLPEQPMAIHPTLLHPLPFNPAVSKESFSSVPTNWSSEDTVVSVQPASSNDAAPGAVNRYPTQPASSLREENAALFRANVKLKEKIKQLTADLHTLEKYKVMWTKESLEKAKVDNQPEYLIPRPPGEKGKNGWNLKEAMGLKDDDALYNEILRTARKCISRSGLNWEGVYSDQEPSRLAACFTELKKQHPYLERFQGNWPAKEMVISALQNRRKALSAKARAKSIDK